jgi:hypothetical protein
MKIKLSKLLDRLPVKLTVTLTPDLASRLRGYADLYAETYGVHEEPSELVPYILDAFLKGDVEFRRANRAKGDNGTAESESNSPSIAHARIEPDPAIRELRKPRMLGPRSDVSEG